MPDCIIKAGESIEPQDSRLSDTACIIEAGVIIRPPPDPTVIMEKPASPRIVQVQPKPVIVQAPAPAAVPKVIEEPIEPLPMPAVNKPVAHTEAPSTPVPTPRVDETGGLNPTTIALTTGAAVAVVGTAAAVSTMGGLSAAQAKIASIFGSKVAVITGGTMITAGMIVAVKALESKMGKLETDMKRAKEEVGGAADSISRIDEMLDRLGS